MNLRTCTFAGHSCVFSSSIGQRLEREIEIFLSDADSAVFYVGGRGDFDLMAAAAVRSAMKRHKNKKIQLYLVEPYMHSGINRDKDYNEDHYSGIIIPQELIGIHPKVAITRRNRWMVDQSDLLIAFVQRDFGGAYETMKYAIKRRIQVINLAGENNCMNN